MVVSWLIGAGLGPAAVGLPVTAAGEVLADVAKRWFKRHEMRQLVNSLTGGSLEPAEIKAVQQLLEDPQTWNLAGQGTVEDLAARIASCLPPRDGDLHADLEQL